MPEIPAEAVQPEDIPAEWVDAVYPVTLKHGIPWHDDAIRIMLAAALPLIAEQARREERARITAHIRAIPEDDEPLRTAACKFIDRHPRLREGTSLVAVLLAVADEIEGDDRG